MRFLRLAPRFSLRRFLIAVLFVGVLIGAGGWFYRSAQRARDAIALLERQGAILTISNDPNARVPRWISLAVAPFTAPRVLEIDMQVSVFCDQSTFSCIERLPTVRRIDLPADQDVSVYDLSAIGRLPRLRAVTRAPVESLVEICTGETLEELDVWERIGRPHEFGYLKASEERALAACAKLESLIIELTDEELPSLSGLVNLRDLYLRGSECDGLGLAALSHLSIEQLDLSHSDVSDRGIRCISNFKRLKTLNLKKCENITEKCLSVIEKMPGLLELDVSLTGLSLKEMVNSGIVGKVEVLRLSSHNCGLAEAQDVADLHPNMALYYAEGSGQKVKL